MLESVYCIFVFALIILRNNDDVDGVVSLLNALS